MMTPPPVGVTVAIHHNNIRTIRYTIISRTDTHIPFLFRSPHPRPEVIALSLVFIDYIALHQTTSSEDMKKKNTRVY